MNKLSKSQMAWARMHDWFAGVSKTGMLIVTDIYVLNGKLQSECLVWEGDFAELKAWAGY